MVDKVTDKPKIIDIDTPQEETSITRVEHTTPDTGITIIAGVSTAQLKEALKIQTEQRKLIKGFVIKHLVKGTDYGSIAGEGKTGRKFESGMVLFKPGQEKIFSLFTLTSKCLADEETLKMLQGTPGLVAYKCEVFRNGQKITEGRGAAKVGDMGRDANATIKIAQKRARMDACLSLGFSEYFTQDMEDPEYKRKAEEARQRRESREKANNNDLPSRAPNLPMNDQERTILAKWMMKRGFNEADEQLELLRINGIADAKSITSGMAMEMIDKLKKSAFAKPIGDLPVIDAEADIKVEVPKEEELVVDEALQDGIRENFETLGLNSRGTMWFFKAVSGKPYGDFNSLDDGGWRKAYEFVMGILDGIINVEDYYIDGLIPMDPVVEPIDNEKKE